MLAVRCRKSDCLHHLTFSLPFCCCFYPAPPCPVLSCVCPALPCRRSLAELAGAYRELRGAYREEYLMYNLAAAALAQVRPGYQYFLIQGGLSS